MAEALFRAKLAKALGVEADHLADVGFNVGSAGIAGGGGAKMSLGSLEALRARGLDGASHVSRPLTADRIRAAQHVFAMTREHKEAAVSLAPGYAGRVEMLDPHGPIGDPIGGGPEVYEACAKQIDSALDVRLKEILDEDRAW